MGLQSKYIILDNELETPIVFSPLLQRDAVAAGKKVLSAGFCLLSSHGDGQIDTWSIWGESVSLKVKSRPEDEYILNNYLSYDC